VSEPGAIATRATPAAQWARSARRAAAALAGASLVAHAAPGLTGIGRVRRAALPRLSGTGRPDHVALSFDDGPDPASTPDFLEALQDLGWRATFFMLGSMVRHAPSLAAEVAEAGHEIATHGDLHHSHLLRLPSDVADDARRAMGSIEDATGARPRWHRPPYGAVAASTIAACRRQGLRLVLWGAWGRDWRPGATPLSVLGDLERGLFPGATVLLHDSDCTSAPGSWRAALGALCPLAESLERRGLQAGPLRDHGLG
jgi:peptidoglycan/xylan/chitin deacetylase (PgdA/CDA1 family)